MVQVRAEPRHQHVRAVAHPPLLAMQFTPKRFFSQLFAKFCCRKPLEKLVELKNEECYERELSEAALAAASGAGPVQDQDDKRSSQIDEKQLSGMIGSS